MKVPHPYILSAIASIAAIESYAPADEQIFQIDSMIQDAILMRLQDLGENLNRVRQQFPEFWATDTWNQAIGLRHLISHEYGSVRMDLIWRVVADDLGPLRTTIEESLSRSAQ